MKVKSESEVAQSCLTPSDPKDCSLPGSSVHGIFQARVLEWGAIAFSRKMVQMSLICRVGIENRHVEWEVNWEMGIDIYTAMGKTQLVGTCCIVEGTQLHDLG